MAGLTWSAWGQVLTPRNQLLAAVCAGRRQLGSLLRTWQTWGLVRDSWLLCKLCPYPCEVGTTLYFTG